MGGMRWASHQFAPIRVLMGWLGLAATLSLGNDAWATRCPSLAELRRSLVLETAETTRIAREATGGLENDLSAARVSEPLSSPRGTQGGTHLGIHLGRREVGRQAAIHPLIRAAAIARAFRRAGRTIHVPRDEEIIAHPQVGDSFLVTLQSGGGRLTIKGEGTRRDPRLTVTLKRPGGRAETRRLTPQQLRALHPQVAPEAPGYPRSRTEGALIGTYEDLLLELSRAGQIPRRHPLGGDSPTLVPPLSRVQEEALGTHLRFATAAARYLRASGTPCEVIPSEDHNAYLLVITPSPDPSALSGRSWLTRLATSIHQRHGEQLAFDTTNVPESSAESAAYFLRNSRLVLPWEDVINPVISVPGTHELRHQNRHHSETGAPLLVFSGRNFQEHPDVSTEHRNLLNQHYVYHFSDEVDAYTYEIERVRQQIRRFEAQPESPNRLLSLRSAARYLRDRAQFAMGLLDYQNETLTSLIRSMERLSPEQIREEVTVSIITPGTPSLGGGTAETTTTSLAGLPEQLRLGARVVREFNGVELEFPEPRSAAEPRDARDAFNVPIQGVARVHLNPDQLLRDWGSPRRNQFLEVEARRGRPLRDRVLTPQVGDVFEMEAEGGSLPRQVEVLEVRDGLQVVLGELRPNADGVLTLEPSTRWSLPVARFRSSVRRPRVLPERITPEDLLTELRYLRWQNDQAYHQVREATNEANRLSLPVR